MRRLLRHTLNGLRLLLLLLTIPLTAAWVYSYRHTDSLARWEAGGRFFRIASGSGTLYCYFSDCCPFKYGSNGWWWIRIDPDAPVPSPPSRIYIDVKGEMWRPPRIIYEIGWHKLAMVAGGPYRSPTAWVRYWTLVVAFAVPASASVVLRSIRARFGARRAARGRCRKCGYDLRATPNLCPECGTIPATGSKTRNESPAAASEGL